MSYALPSKAPFSWLHEFAARPPSSLNEDITLIRMMLHESDYLTGYQRLIVNIQDFTLLSKEFREWFLAIVASKTPPRELSGLYFGITNSHEMIVTGSLSYDENDDDWASNDDWAPDEELLSPFSVEFGATGEMDGDWWVAGQAVSIAIIRDFFNLRSQEFFDIAPVDEIAIATGYWQGDLYTIFQKLERTTRSG